MCFSVTASFSSGIALLVCGIASLHRARNKERLKMIAAVPLIFGLQQFAEGFIWLSFINPESFAWVRMIAAYFFLTVAGVIWPVWASLALIKYEQSAKHYFTCLSAGIIVAFGFIGYMLFYPITVTAGCNIIYYFDKPAWIENIGTCLYLLATLVPFFLTRNSMLWIIGGLIGVAYIVSYIFYLEAFTSVWCFFAAIISILIYGFVANESRKK